MTHSRTPIPISLGFALHYSGISYVVVGFRGLHENWEEIYHLFARHWVQTYRTDVDEWQRKREALALAHMWTTHTSDLSHYPARTIHALQSDASVHRSADL